MRVQGRAGMRLVVSALALTAITGLGVVGARGEGSRGVVGSDVPLGDNPTVQACMTRGTANCNPTPGVYATFVANNPLARPDRSGSQLLSDGEAIRLAGGASGSVSATARLVTYRFVAQLDKGLGENGEVWPDRQVWVVTVHGNFPPGPGFFPVLAGAPPVLHVYSMVIDAETGIKTDVCFGCEAVK